MSLPPDIQKIVDESGNSFHARVAQWFQAAGWAIAVSPYYMDQTQQKAREIDLIAERSWPIRGHFQQDQGDLLVRLYIECKFIAVPTVLWFAAKDTAAAKALVSGSGPFQPDNTYTDKHHYLSGNSRVAKLFESARAKGQETDPVYRALNQVLNAYVAMRGNLFSLRTTPDDGSRRQTLLEYPVVVCSSFDQLYEVDFLGRSPGGPVGDNFELEVQYAYTDRGGSHRTDYFLIDIVAYDRLEAFASAIDTDARSAAYLAGF